MPESPSALTFQKLPVPEFIGEIPMRCSRRLPCLVDGIPAAKRLPNSDLPSGMIKNQKQRSMKLNSNTWLTLLGAVMLTTPVVNAADIVWVGGSADWNSVVAWSPAQVPTATDNVWITNSGNYTVTVPAGTTAANNSLTIGGATGTQTLAVDRATLTLNGNSAINLNGQLTLLVPQSLVTGPGSIVVNGTLNWVLGSITGTGQLTVNSGGIFAIGSGNTTLGRSLNNSGTGTWAGGNLTVNAGNSVNNLAGGTFDITADGRISGAASTPVNNSGLVRLTAGTTGTTLTVPFNNSGTLQVLSSTLNLNLGGVHSGSFSNASGASLNFGGGAHVLNAGSFVTGAGTLSLSGGATLTASGTFDVGTTLSLAAGTATLAPGCNVAGTTLDLTSSGSVLVFDSAGTVATVNVSAGILGGTSPITVTGALTLGGGNITNKLIVANGGIAIQGNTTLNGVRLVNPATTVWSAGNITGSNGAAISNLLGAAFINTFDGNMATGSGLTPIFVNAGTFQKTNGTAALGTTSIDFQFFNTGTVEVRTNTLRYSSNQQTAGLTVLDGGGLSAQAQPLQFLGGGLIGTGLVTVANAQNVINSSSISPGLPLGELDITGNYQQTASGALNIELGGYSPGTNFDLLSVTAGGAGGVANLGGALNVTLTNGFSPTNGASFTFLTASSRVGAFASFNYPSNDIGMQLVTDATSAMLKITNLKPVVANPIADPVPTTYGQTFNFQFPANTFIDPDNNALSYAASGMPSGVNFTGSTRTFSGAPDQAGIFTIAVAATDNGTPSLTVTNTFTLTVNPTPLTIAVLPAAKVYGSVDPTLGFTASGFQFSDTQASVLTGALKRASGEDVAGGPYAITRGTLAANGNYAINFTGSTLIITPATLTIAAQARTKTYGATDPALAFVASGFQFSDTQALVLTGAPARVLGETVAGGPYAITQGTLAANGNYTINFTGNTLSITPASLTITAQAKSKAYGTTDPPLTFTATGFQFSDTKTSVLSGALTRALGETVAGGPYAITQGTLAANANYTIGFTGSTLAITAATLTIAAQVQTKAYGATDPVLSFTASGFQFSDTQASVLTGALTRAPGESVTGGPYAITQGTLAANANYTIGFTGSTLTITPAALTIAAQAKSKSYGATDPALTFTISGLQFSDPQASVLTGALTRAAGESVAGSPYAITQGTLAANGNYAIAFTGNTLAITPATLFITADSKSKIFGATDPILTVTYAGFVNGESAAVLSGTLVITRAPGENVGSYVITPAGLTAVNYAIIFNPGSLSITAPSSTTLSLARNGTASVTLTWNSVSNVSYRVQYKSDLGAPNWTDLAGDVVASGITASKNDVLTATNRFYRVRPLP